MGFLDVLKKKMSKESFEALRDELGDDFDDDYVPRSRLNTVIKQRNELKELVDTPETSTEPKAKVESTKTLTQADVDKAVAEAQAASDKLMADKLHELAILDKLRGADAFDAQLALSKIDKTKPIEEIDAQIAELQKASSFLFNTGEHGTGRTTVEDKTVEKTAIDAKLDSIFANAGVILK